MIDMLPQIKLKITLLPVNKCRGDKGPTDCDQKIIVWKNKVNGDALKATFKALASGNNRESKAY